MVIKRLNAASVSVCSHQTHTASQTYLSGSMSLSVGGDMACRNSEEQYLTCDRIGCDGRT